MEKKLRILILEDNVSDCELLERELRREKMSITVKRVDSSEAFKKELGVFEPDIILADYKLPDFDALSALDLVKKFSPEIPFIVVTGSVSEEIAVDCIKAGAVDYILKDRLTRLVPAIMKALEKKKIQSEKDAALEALRRSEQRYRTIFDVSPEVIVMISADGTVLDINGRVYEYVGYHPHEIARMKISELPFLPAHSRETLHENFIKVLNGEKIAPYEVEYITKDGRRRFGSVYSESLRDENDIVIAVLAVIFDVTDQREASEALCRERDMTQMYFEASGVMLVVLNRDKTVALINKKGCEILGYEKKDILGKNWLLNFLPPSYREETEAIWKGFMEGQMGPFGKVKGSIINKLGDERVIMWNNSLLRDATGFVVGTLSSGEDITERERSEEELKKTLTALKEFKELTVGRENRMIELKKEINKLSEELGRTKPYDVSFSE
jgi:PAS domain S-box-containing protein